MAKRFAFSISLLCAAGLLCGPARALEVAPGVDLNSTVWLGYRFTRPSTGTSTDPLHDEPEVGAVTSLRWGRLSAFTMVTYDNSNQFANTVPYANLAYDFSVLSLPFRIKGGRLRIENNLYGAARYSPFTRLGVIPPLSVTFDVQGTALASGTGVSLELEKHGFLLRYSATDPDTGNWHRNKNLRWLGGSLNHEFGTQRTVFLRYTPIMYNPLSLSAAHTSLSLFKNSAADMELITLNAEHWSHGLRLLAETTWLKRGADTDWFRDSRQLGFAYSLTAEYEFYPDVSLRLNYNGYQTAQAKIPVPDRAAQAQDYNVGLRYMHGDLLIGVEYHYLNGCRWQDPATCLDSAYDHWSVVAANIAYKFEF